MLTEETLLPLYVRYYKDGKLDHLLTSGVAKTVVLKIYRTLLVYNKVTPIEHLTRDQKIELIKECGQQVNMPECCRMLLTLKYFCK